MTNQHTLHWHDIWNMRFMKASIQRGKDKLQHTMQNLSQEGFKKIYNNINQYGIKQSVDKRGLDGFIEHCARLAAGTGALAGTGGAITMIASLPVDVINNITQQFRVTLAILYDNRGTYQFTFDEFMAVVATSMKVEAGVMITKSALEEIAEKLLLKMGTKAAGRLIPVVGAVIGGTANYLFVKGVAKAVKEMEFT